MTILLVMCMNETEESHGFLRIVIVLFIFLFNSVFIFYALYLICIEFKINLRDKIIHFFQKSKLTSIIMVQVEKEKRAKIRWAILKNAI